MWIMIAILGLVLFIICLPALIFSIKKKKRGASVLYIAFTGISYGIMLFAGLEAISGNPSGRTAEPPVSVAQAQSELREEHDSANAPETSPASNKEDQPVPSADAASVHEEGNGPDEIISDEIPNQTEPEPVPEQMTASGGIGDKLSVLEDKYGYNAGDETHASFKRGALEADILSSGRVYKIEYGYLGSIADALNLISDMIPADSVQLDIATSSNMSVIAYHSDMLASVVQPGDFIAKIDIVGSGEMAMATRISINLGTLTRNVSGETETVTPME